MDYANIIACLCALVYYILFYEKLISIDENITYFINELKKEKENNSYELMQKNKEDFR